MPSGFPRSATAPNSHRSINDFGDTHRIAQPMVRWSLHRLSCSISPAFSPKSVVISAWQRSSTREATFGSMLDSARVHPCLLQYQLGTRATRGGGVVAYSFID